ncbi:MAG: RsmB/NOP family class I SAM-dependent RNA methyltransferase [Rhodospirillaceae bacterium]
MTSSSDTKARSDSASSRAVALALLSGVLRDGKPVDSRFQKVAGTLQSRDRAFVRLLVATTLRHLGQIDAVLGHFIVRTPVPPVEDSLRLGAAQILFLDTAPHAAVDTSVELVKRVRQAKMTGLVNAVLRKVVKQGKNLLRQQDAIRLSAPSWLWDGWVKAYGNHAARAIAKAHLTEASLDVSLRDPGSIEMWVEELNAFILPTGSLRCEVSGRIQELPGFEEGAWWVQDAAAALPAKVLLQALGETKGKTVADFCSAPGGKTLQLAAAGCAVTSIDKSEARLSLLQDNLKRVDLKAEVVKEDILHWTPKCMFDAVLLDAPCSATGTLRRHPDLGYIKSRKEIRKHPHIQEALLRKAATAVYPGGNIVYAVCSLEPDECAAVVDSVANEAGLSRIPIHAKSLGAKSDWIDEAGAFRTLPSFWPDYGGLDGFYIALLKKV